MMNIFRKKKTTDKVDKVSKETDADKDAKNPAKKKTTKKVTKKVPKKGSLLGKLFYMVVYFCLIIGLILIFGIWLYARELDKKYELSNGALEGVLWALPSRVYARPLDLYQGRSLQVKDLKKELEYLGYRSDKKVSEAGTYQAIGNEVIVYKNAFDFWDGKEVAQRISIKIANNKVSGITDTQSREILPITRLEPLLIGSIYPKHGQDRVLINLDETPTILVDTIIATEDRRFYSHPGIDAKGIARALIQALKNGKVRQGASTLTQQFVKNHYLTRERRLSRKIKEAIIAVILERNYSKRQILEGYLNEIFLGQDGGRAIHGFGLASEFYFGMPLKDLGVHQIASLVALVREPARANPFRHPQYAKKRRALILDVMAQQRLISQKDADLAKSLPLDVLPKVERVKKDKYYSFLQLVYKQLGEHYDKEQLAEGLNVFTTLDPIIQEKTEKAVADGLNVLEKRHRLKKNFLQAASVIVNTPTAEVVAIVGDRDAGRHGFNRAIQAQRQPGSLLKPVVYLSALEYLQKYNLSTMIDDSPLEYRAKGEVWKPKNYAKNNHGQVMLIDGLVKSYNIPTARIGLDIGIDDVIGRLEDLGARKDLPKYPSIVLGAVAMSPLEIAQIYESLANGGYRMPLRVINNITDANGYPVKRYPMQSVQVISPGPYYLIIKAMKDVVKRGTAARLKQKISPNLEIAGKTGTTDDYRDSWFSGFSGNYLNVVWVGNDDNQRTGLSGSNGAMRVWMDVSKNLPMKPLYVKKPDNIFNFEIDATTGELMSDDCRGQHKSVNLPFIRGTEPISYSSCFIEAAPGGEIEFESLENSGFGNENTNSLWYNQ